MTVSFEPLPLRARLASALQRPIAGVASSYTYTYIFWSFALAHLVAWTFIPTLVSPNAPLDVIEGYVWGHEWLLGTYKHPPMQAWWLEILTSLTNHAPWTHFLASQIAVVIAFWAVWKTGQRLMTKQAAMIGVLLLEGVLYYNFTSPEFNPNVLQLPFWALTALYFHRSIKDNHWSDWALLGLWSACGLYTKYSAGVLLIILAALLVLHPESRKRLKGSGPYITLAVTTLLCLPHLIWLIDNQFIPFDYIQSRLHHIDAPSEYVMRPVRFVLSQLGAVALLGVLLVMVTGKKIFAPQKSRDVLSFDRVFLNTLTFGPLAVFFIIGMSGERLHDMWGTPLMGFVGLWAISHFRADYSSISLRRFAYGWVAISTGILISYAVSTIYYPYISHKAQRIYFPGQELAKDVISTWEQTYHLPLQYIIGDTWPAGNIAYYPPGRQHVLIDGNYTISPWIKSADIEKHGGILVWCIANCTCKNQANDPPDYLKNFPQAQFQKPLVLSRQTGADVPPVTIGWALLPPASR